MLLLHISIAAKPPATFDGLLLLFFIISENVNILFLPQYQPRIRAVQTHPCTLTQQESAFIHQKVLFPKEGKINLLFLLL